MNRRSRTWWFCRFLRAYHKHGCLRSQGLRRTWDTAMIGRRMMDPAEQRKLGPIYPPLKLRLLARCQQAVWAYDEWPMSMRGPLFDHIEPHPSWADAFFALVGRFCGWIV